MKIGFFDSGLGGITIMKAVAKELPEYDYEFYGDTANLPYGDKDEETIFSLTKQGIEHLFNQGCLIIVIACNTASAETLRKLQNDFLIKNYPDRKILGVIIPTVETLITHSIKNTFLIGTNRTIDSKKYIYEFEKYNEAPQVNAIATPSLVSLIEEEKYNEAYDTVCSIIDQRTTEEAIILGCTHYTILSEKLEEKYSEANFKIFSQDEIIPKKLKTYLENHPELESKLSKNFKRNIFLTKHNPTYDKHLQELLGGIFI